jgi:hypothetical protein
MDIKNNITPWEMLTARSSSNAQSEENNRAKIKEKQNVLERRYRLGTLCEWTGIARKWAISLSTAIDDVMNILLHDADIVEFSWEMNFKASKTTQTLSFIIGRQLGQVTKP